MNIAAEKLFKSPSTVSHALHKIQQQLGLSLFKQKGRKLYLTSQGESTLKQAKRLIEEKQVLFEVAEHLQIHHHNEISLTVDAIYPLDLLLAALDAFSAQFPLCHINLHEAVLSGAEERFLNGQADICIAYRVPQGYLGERLIDIPFIPVISRSHPLFKQATLKQGATSAQDLSTYRQVVISDSGSEDKVDSGWLKATQRWTVSSMATAIKVIKSGMAFGWIPEHLIYKELASGELIPLTLKLGGEKTGSLFITLADEQNSLALTLAKILKHKASNKNPKQNSKQKPEAIEIDSAYIKPLQRGDHFI